MALHEAGFLLPHLFRVLAGLIRDSQHLCEGISLIRTAFLKTTGWESLIHSNEGSQIRTKSQCLRGRDLEIGFSHFPPQSGPGAKQHPKQ